MSDTEFRSPSRLAIRFSDAAEPRHTYETLVGSYNSKPPNQQRSDLVPDLPPTLVSAVAEQRVILFLGAGASNGATHPDGSVIPQGNKLRDLVSDRFLGGSLKDRPLNVVSAFAASETSLSEFQNYIRHLFLPFEPSHHHLLVPTFRWRAIATTNFDLLVEKSYGNVTDSQSLVTTVKDGDNFDRRMSSETDPVGFYKLHGCINFHTDTEIPFIIGDEQYASYDKNRKRLYGRFRDLAHECPIVFCGYSVSDPHIQHILFDLTDAGIARPHYYIVSPEFDDIEARYWSKYRISAINCTYEEFLMKLDASVSTTSRKLPADLGGGTLSIRKHYRIANAEESRALALFLSNDVTHVHSGLKADAQDAKEFYRGYDTGWGGILQNLDARRGVNESVLVDRILVANDHDAPADLVMLKGPGGNGKTVSLKRIAWEAGVTYDKLVLYTDDVAGLRIDILSEIAELTGKRLYLFVDRVALLRNELRDLLSAARQRRMALSVIGAERDNEWHIYCEQLEPYVIQEFPVRYLSEPEIRSLVVLLEQHSALGLLESLSFERRVEKFVEGAERQILVALHEITLGQPFEDIVIDEYRRIEPPDARQLYLHICVLHQFGTPIRAGLISRLSGIRFEDFQERFVQPLKNVVGVVKDRHTGDLYYRSRHQHVAQIVFNGILSTPDNKFEALLDMMDAINVDYSSDRETFSRLIRGRQIASIFPSAELGRVFYDHVLTLMSNLAFVWHQRAVFEMQHPEGKLSLAEDAAQQAGRLNPDNRTIRHTLAEISRRRANKTRDPLLKKALRRTARDKLARNSFQSSEYDMSTTARLYVDEFMDLANEYRNLPADQPPRPLIVSAREAETAIQTGLQRFPESSDLLSVEARFRDYLDQTEQARLLLERAFNLNPRHDWLAVRLGRRYKASGDVEKCENVLQRCLEVNPHSKAAHLELGRLAAQAGHKEKSLAHLKRSFTTGDNNYEAQFWYARELFVQGDIDEATVQFGHVHRNAPSRFRQRASAIAEIGGKASEYTGRIERKEEGYAFVTIEEMGNCTIFAARSESDSKMWEAVAGADRVKFELGFSRRGPRACSVRPLSR